MREFFAFLASLPTFVWPLLAIAFGAALVNLAKVLTPWRPRLHVPWSFVDTLAGFLAYYVIAATIQGLVLATTTHPDDSSAELSLPMSIGAQVVAHACFAGLLYFMVRSRGSRAPWSDLGFRPHGNVRAIVLGLLAAFLSYPLIETAQFAQTQLWILCTGEAPAPQPVLEKVLEMPSGVERAFVLGAVAFLVPVGEELLFRGFIQPAFVHAGGPAVGIVATSLVFAVIHEREVWVMIFAFSCVLGWLYHRTGRLGACCALHALNNAVAVYVLPLLR